MTTDIKFSQLPNATTLDETEVFPIFQTGQDVKIALNSTADQPYEEGTWTPTLYGTSSAGTVTYKAQEGEYTRIGRMVFLCAQLEWTSFDDTEQIKIGGFIEIE